MTVYNNTETLDHHEGLIWVSKSFQTEKRGNICVFLKGTFQVLAYVSPAQLENKDLHTLVHEVITANGSPYMLEETTIMCMICNKLFHEADVNIVDYEDDVCIHCEPTYSKL